MPFPKKSVSRGRIFPKKNVVLEWIFPKKNVETMKRFIYNELKEWKLSATRKPLIIYGARQVGKTYILREFGEKEFESLVYVNCYKNAAVEELFRGDVDVRRLTLGLSAVAGKPIVPGKTLLFLDEIQEIPPVLSSLKYFCEDMPGLHVAVAGSLLGVMSMKGESFPVGKVNIMHLYPMTFTEFLMACGEEEKAKLLSSGEAAVINALLPKYTDLLRQYYYVGGMPEAVLSFSQKRDPGEVRRIQKDILTAYESDISKHTGVETARIRMVWNGIPSQLARENKKFVYGALRKGARAKDFEIAIQWLVDAGLVHKVERVRDVRLPLKFYADIDSFKLYVLDVGLLGAMAGTSAAQVIVGDGVFSEYKGAFTENYVLQQLKTIADLPIYYFSKENSTMEVDFVAQVGDSVVPIEVKAEVNVKAKSLYNFINVDYASQHYKGLRLSMLGFQDQGWMANAPLCAAREVVSLLTGKCYLCR